MIQIVGVQEGSEYEAAVHLRRLILNLWPDLAQNRGDTVKIFVGLKMYGQKTEDLDLVVIGSFAEPRPFDVEFAFYPNDGARFIPRSAKVRNFALVIEVKSHDATGVRFENTLASVRYQRNGRTSWECVTEKNRTQMFEFKKYLDRYGMDHVHVQDLVFFTGLKEADLPKRPHNCIASDTSFERILNVLGQVSRPREHDRKVTLSYGSDDAFAAILSPKMPLFDTLEPTPLDRRRMDLIAKKALPDAWLDDLGERHIFLRGRGGVGKTVILLQMAYRAFDQKHQRSLVLTFNKALVADMRRTMALLGVPRSVEKGGVGIETAHSFFGRLMLKLGVIEDYATFLDKYDSHKEMLLSYLRSGAVTREDINDLIKVDASEFDWDLVFVDEGQDWPGNEIAILNTVYGNERLIVSDGIDQYVRETVADWSLGIGKGGVRSHRLTKCLRMKTNLALFVEGMAEALGLDDWDLEPNADASGGRVIVVEGNLAADPSLVGRLRDQAMRLGNWPVDMLACVPPSLAMRSKVDDLCSAAVEIVRGGGSVWDGTAREVREQYPTRREELRLVQYDSCRGLEGWTTINYGLDEFWDYKYRQWFTEDHDVQALFQTTEDLARQHASRWVMIPMTRAIDTLVINVTGASGVLRTALMKVSVQRGDFVEWIRLTT